LEEVFDNVTLVNVKFTGMENIVHALFMTTPYFISLTFSSLYFSVKSIKAIRNINPDIICLTDRFSGIFPARLKTPKVYVLHVPDGLDFSKPFAIYANKLNSVLFYVKKLLDYRIMSRSDKAVVLNRFIGNFLKTKGFSNVINIPNGIEIEKFSNKGDGMFILYAGRFDWNKNVYSLVNAFAEIHKLNIDYDLYLVGSGPEERRIRALVKEKGLQSSVKIIPWMPRNKLIDLMSRCSIFVLPSFSEVFPVVLLEAMASAKPVIARANMGSVEAIVHGFNGFLYERDDEMIRYIRMLISNENLRRTMGDSAKKTVEKKYAFSKIAELYEKKCFNEIYRQS
jgi:glycosyltransferase involved in cell wall biosynthesis